MSDEENLGHHGPSVSDRLSWQFQRSLALAAFKADYAWRKANDARFPAPDALSLPDDDASLDKAFASFDGLEQKWMAVARAVVEAMRKPTPMMLDHLADAMGDTDDCHKWAPIAWDAAIDEALG